MDREALQVLELSDADVAERDAWEPRALSPRTALSHVVHELKSVEVVGGGEEGVQKEELANGVNDVQDLHKEVHGRQVAAGAFVAEEAEEAGSLVLGADEHIPLVLLVGVKPFVHESRQSIQRFVSVIWAIILGLLGEVNAFIHI